MASVGASAAQGLQAGWQMGMQADEAELRRQTTEDSIRQRDREFGLREKQYADQQSKLQTADEYNLLGDEHKQLLAERAAMEAAGQAPTSEFNQRVIQNRSAYRAHVEKRRAPMLAAEHAEAQRFFADLQAGNVDPSSVDPAKFYRNFSVATRMTPKDLAAAVQGAQLVQQGHETGNQQILLQGVNQLVSNDLKAGVGSTSPHGGVVTRKEIVGLIPVKDANGVEHPDKVFPLVRTYVMHPNSAGDEDYYDAPLTQNRSSDPNDPPKAVDLAHAFDYMGKLGALAQVMQHPEAAAKLAEGEKLVGAQTQADVDEMNALGKRSLQESAKGAVAQKIQSIYATLPPGEERDKAVRVALGVEAAPKAPAAVPAGVQREKLNLEQVDAAEKAGEITPSQAAKERQDIRLGARGRIAVPPPPKAASGSKAKGVGAGGGGGTSDKYSKDPEYAKAVDFWAQTMGNGGDLPPGFARANKDMYSDIVARAPAFSKGATDAMASRAEYGGAKAGARTVGQRAANFGLAKSEAYEMADLVTETSDSVSRTKFMPINRAILAYEKNTGDPDVVQFGAAINSFINAYARAVSPVGTPTVSDKNHAREMLEMAQSHEQVVATIGQLKREMVAAGNAPKTVRNEQRAAIVGMGEGRGGTGAAPAAAGAPARVQTATNPKTGEKLMLQNGQWVPFK